MERIFEVYLIVPAKTILFLFPTRPLPSFLGPFSFSSSGFNISKFYPCVLPGRECDGFPFPLGECTRSVVR